MFYTYILYSQVTESFYKGSTRDLSNRIIRHNKGYEIATRDGIPWILLWSTKKGSRSEAQILEFKLKNLSRKRICEFMLKFNEDVGGPDELLLIKQLSGC